MSVPGYTPNYLTHPVVEALDLHIEGASFGAVRGLACRWPEGAAPKACVIFGHGLGESGLSYAELCRYWAAHGYLVICPTFADWIEAIAAAHPDIGEALEGHDPMDWSSLPDVAPMVLALLHQPFYWLERIRIVREILGRIDDIMAATCGAPKSQIPLAIAGHSFGAYLSQLFAGAEIDVPGQGATSFKDDRFRAAILLSAQGRDQQGLREGSWDPMTGPVLNVTGTLDGGARGQDWHWKCEPYDFAPPGGKYLAVIENAAHNLGGVARITKRENDPAQRDAVHQLTLAFLDAYPMGDPAALEWLSSITDRIGGCPVLFKRK